MRIAAPVLALSLLTPSLAAQAGELGIFGQPGDVDTDLVTPERGVSFDGAGNMYLGYSCVNAPIAHLVSSAPGQKNWATDVAGEGALAVAWESGELGRWAITLYRTHCDREDDVLGRVDLTPTSNPPTMTSMYGSNFGFFTAVDAQHRLCVSSNRGVECLGAGNPLAVELFLPLADVEAQVAPGGRWSELLPAIPVEATKVGDHFGAMVFAPDGRLFTVLSIEVAYGGISWDLLWLIERKLDGNIVVRHGPELVSHNAVSSAPSREIRNTLSFSTSLGIDKTTETLFVWPVSGHRFLLSPFAGHQVYEGVGVATFRLDGTPNPNDRPGHIELSTVLQEVLPGNLRQIGMIQGPNAPLFSTTLGPQGPMGTFKLHYDPETIDLDEDGLTASDERLLGTSDYAKDSDGGGTRDILESRVYHTNPAVGSDDPAPSRRHDLTVDYAYSSLIRERLDIQVDEQVWNSKYLCGMGKCYDEKGTKVFEGSLYGPWLTEDGVHAVGETATEVMRWSLVDGTSELVVNLGDLQGLVGAAVGGTRIIPGKGSRLFLVSPLGDRVLVFGDRPVRVLFDLPAEVCKSRLGTCADPLMGGGTFLPDTYTNVRIVGFDPVADRLIVLVTGNMDTLLVGLTPDADPVILARGGDYPPYVLDTGMGAFLSAAVPTKMVPLADGELWCDFEGAHGFCDSEYTPWAGHNLPFLGNEPSPGWESYFQNAAGGPTMYGLWEMVRVEQVIEKGDVIMFAGPNSLDLATLQNRRTEPLRGPYLYKIGRRGEVSIMFNHYEFPSLFASFGAVRGMGVAPDGRVCAAGMDGKLRELTEPNAKAVPQNAVEFPEIEGASDCLYDDSGRLHVLIESPMPGVLVFDSRMQTSQGEMFPVNELSTPARFVLGRDGVYRIADAAGPMICFDPATGSSTKSSVSAAGLTIGNNGNLFVIIRPEGRLGEVDLPSACTGAPRSLEIDTAKLMAVTNRPAYPWIVANVVQRPDGRFMLMPSRDRLVGYDLQNPINDPAYLFYFDPSDESFQVSHLDFGEAGTGSAMALVKGAAWTDPWAEGSSPIRPDGGTGPGSRDGGVSATPGDSGSKDEKCACSSAHRAPPGWPTLLLVGIVGIVLERRRSNPCG